jgi:hypothetical protein
MERAFEIASSHHVVGANLFRDDEDTILAAAGAGQAEVLAAAFLAGLVDRQKEDSTSSSWADRRRAPELGA